MSASTMPVNPDYVIANRDKLKTLHNRAAKIVGVRRGMNIAQVLGSIAHNELVEDATYGHITKLEAVMRVVFDMALMGDKWCINFIAERMEGKATQNVMVHNSHGDVREMPTGILIDMIQDQGAAIEQAVNERIAEMIAQGELVLPNRGDVVQSDSHDAQVENSEVSEG